MFVCGERCSLLMPASRALILSEQLAQSGGMIKEKRVRAGGRICMVESIIACVDVRIVSALVHIENSRETCFGRKRGLMTLTWHVCVLPLDNS